MSYIYKDGREIKLIGSQQKRKKNKEALYSKSNGICQLCGEMMLLEAEETDHPLLVSSDHKVARTYGGKLHIDNFGVSHSWCNSYRRHKNIYKYITEGKDPIEAERRQTKMNDAVVKFMWRSLEREKIKLIEKFIDSLYEIYCVGWE